MIEFFFLTAKALTIYSLGFGIAAVSDLKKKKEPTKEADKKEDKKVATA